MGFAVLESLPSREWVNAGNFAFISVFDISDWDLLTQSRGCFGSSKNF
jgi:hypothetical protein